MNYSGDFKYYLFFIKFDNIEVRERSNLKESVGVKTRKDFHWFGYVKGMIDERLTKQISES